MNSLARLHVSMRRMPKHLLIKQEKVQSEESKQDMTEGNAVTNTHKERQSLACQYEKHNRELRRVRAYLRRKNKNARKYASSHKELLMKLPYWPQHKESAP